MVREKLTGEAPPPSARKLVDQWRSWIEEKAGGDLDRLGEVIGDQKAFARATRDILVDLDMGDELSEAPDQASDDADDQEGDSQDSSEQSQSGEAEQPEGSSADQVEYSEGEGEEGDEQTVEVDADDRARRTATPTKPVKATSPGARYPAGRRQEPRRLQDFHTAIRRSDRRRRPLRSRGAVAPAPVSRSAIAANANAPSEQPSAAPPDGAAESQLGVRSRGRHPRCGAPDPRRRSTRCTRSSFKVEHDIELPRHGGDAAARQFGLDARPADHGCRDVRRYSGAYAGTLRRQGRDPRLHHTRLEGRAVTRDAGWRKASQRSPAASTICATSSTNRPTSPWRRARRNLGLMMREGLLKENIDGEALIWAHSRLLYRPEAAPHPDGDFRRRAGRRFDLVGQCGAVSGASTCGR